MPVEGKTIQTNGKTKADGFLQPHKFFGRPSGNRLFRSMEADAPADLAPDFGIEGHVQCLVPNLLIGEGEEGPSRQPECKPGHRRRVRIHG